MTFSFENNELVHKDKKNDIARIKFVNWQQLASINILIQDKNQQKFNIILFDGEGNDALYGGDGDDILITTGGNVTLMAGKGNNIIFINQLNGHIKIINSGGKDTIILQDKKIADYQIFDHNGNRSYLSSDSLSGILIEDYEQKILLLKLELDLMNRLIMNKLMV